VFKLSILLKITKTITTKINSTTTINTRLQPFYSRKESTATVNKEKKKKRKEEERKR